MKKYFQAYLFVVLATTLLLALLKLAGSPATTWGWVLFPILGSLVMWLLFIGAVTTVGLIWPKDHPFVPDDAKPLGIPDEKYRMERLKVDRDMRLFRPGQTMNEAHEAYYRKALALELATLAHDTPGFIEWEKRGETLIGELKILVRND